MDSLDVCISKFKTIRIENEKEVIFRAAIASEEEANEWLNEFKTLSRTQWSVHQTYPNVERLKYHKKYSCGFGSKNKTLAEGVSPRNHDCPVKMHIKIKIFTKDTIKKDKYLRERPPLCGVITVIGTHSHNSSSTVMKFLRPGDSLRRQFEEYFHNGMCAGPALRHHEAMVRTMENGVELLANGHSTPLYNTVYWWYKCWRTVNYGPLDSPLETLQQKVELYKEKGVTLVVRDESPWAVLVATPVMKRAQGLFCSKLIIFSDTTATCDSSSCNVTVMLTATKAGAVPLSIILHEAQTTDSYRIGFRLYQETFPNGFGGETHPVVFMTDNSRAEKGALSDVWPESKQILCGFHVGQAEWEWLHSNAISDARKPLMKAFQNIQYAKSAEKLEEAIENLKAVSLEYFDKRVSGLLATKEEWVQLFRVDLPIGGNNTDNYSEASIRVLKDVILERTKASNACSLVDYISSGWETYLQTRLSRFAYKKNRKGEKLYNDLARRMPSTMAENIQVVDEDTSIVPSSKSGEPTYEVVVSAGMCNCPAGAAGAFCKHQALVHEKFDRMFPNQPLTSSADRYLLGCLAFGSECPDKSFFLDPKESLEHLESDLKKLEEVYGMSLSPPIPNEDAGARMEMHPSTTSETEEDEEDESDADDAVKKFIASWESMCKLGTETNPKGFIKFVKRATASMNKVTTSNKAFETMMRTAAAVKGKTVRNGKKIPVQPKSIGRRRAGLTKGHCRVPAGRPPKSKSGKKNKKHVRKLAASVNLNKTHYKKH